MASSTSPRLSLLFFIILTTSYATKSAESSNKKSTSGPQINVTKNLFFADFNPNNPTTNQEITLLGSAAISTQKGCIQVPESGIPYSSGRAIYSSPVRLFDPTTRAPASYQTTFSFQLHSPSNTSGSNSGALSFIIASDEFTIGRPWIGTPDYDACEDGYKAVAVVLDASMKTEFGHSKGSKIHVGVDLGSMVSTILVNSMDFLNDGSVYRAWIVYNGTEKFISIFLGPDGSVLPTTSVYSGTLDLAPYFNEYMFVGFSASTGDINLTQVYSVCSWNFTSVSRAFLRVPSAEACDSKIHVENEGNNDQNAHRKTPSIFLVFMAVFVLVLAILISLFLIGRKNEKGTDETVMAASELSIRSPMPPNSARKFGFAEISSMTQGFGQSQVLGSDSRSVTYKGTFSNGCNVAVKRYSNHFSGSGTSDRQRMRKKVKEMAKIRHPNLVPIRGWCFDRHEMVVVYDFIPNGSLDKWLFGFGELPWTRRFKVIKDAAEALSYVHTKELAHKNVKTSSVLFDASFRAVVGDYGFILSSTESTQFEALVSQKVDVFEFGVLMLEVVSGRGRRSGPGEMDLLNLAWAMHERGEKGKLVDKRMGSAVNIDQANRVLEVGLMCTLNDNKGRPSIELVGKYLNVEKPMPELPSSRPVSFFPYSSATGLCSGYSCASFK